MKVAVMCHSPLLQKSLELFLSKYLSSPKKSDIVIRDAPCLDDRRCFYIASDPNAHLQKPFSKSQLILALEKHYASVYKKQEEGDDFALLEQKIAMLTQQYQENILQTVRAFYEKR